MKAIWIILFLFFVASCTPMKWATEHRDELCDMLNCCPTTGLKTSITIESDTAIGTNYVPKIDTFGFSLFARCDSNNQVLLERVEQLDKEKDSIRTEMESDRITVTGYSKDSSKTINKEVTTLKTRTDTVTVKETVYRTKEVDHVPWYFWVITGAALIGIFILGLRL